MSHRLVVASVFAAVSAAVFALFSPAVDASASAQMADCPLTTAPDPPFLAPSPYPAIPPAGTFWYGTPQLWTILPMEGRWRLLHGAKGFREKLFWWRPGFDGEIERKPELTVFGKRLDQPGSFVRLPPATIASSPDFGGSTILTGIDIPTAGCWELTGAYRGSTVTFVAQIEP